MKRLLREKLVLIVDDVPLNLLILEQVLHAREAKVVKAGNGREALALLEDHPVEIILTDLQMPEMDGWEMATCIRKSNKWYRQLPIIATTAETEEADRQKCFAVGMNAVVHKPVDPATIYQKIETVLWRESHQDIAGANNGPAAAFDLSYLTDVTNGDRDCFLLIVDNLRENGPLLLLQATDSVHKCNWANVATHLHKLKGLTALFGMQTITDTLLKAEQETKMESPCSAQVLDKIEWISTQLTDSIKQMAHYTQTN